MLPALGGEHYFAPLPSLGGGLNSPPNAYWELFLLTWQASSRPIILLPAAAGSIISIFEQKRTKQIPFSFPSFPVLENQCAFFAFVHHFSKKTLPVLVPSTFLKAKCTNSAAHLSYLPPLGRLQIGFVGHPCRSPNISGQQHFGDIRLKWACIDDGMLSLLISMPMFGTIHTACDEKFAWQRKFSTALVLGPGAEGCRRHLVDR